MRKCINYISADHIFIKSINNKINLKISTFFLPIIGIDKGCLNQSLSIALGMNTKSIMPSEQSQNTGQQMMTWSEIYCPQVYRVDIIPGLVALGGADLKGISSCVQT